MKGLAILFNVLFYICLVVGILFIILNLAYVIIADRWERFLWIISPLNVKNYIAVVVVFLPAVISKMISNAFKRKISK